MPNPITVELNSNDSPNDVIDNLHDAIGYLVPQTGVYRFLSGTRVQEPSELYSYQVFWYNELKQEHKPLMKDRFKGIGY